VVKTSSWNSDWAAVAISGILSFLIHAIFALALLDTNGRSYMDSRHAHGSRSLYFEFVSISNPQNTAAATESIDPVEIQNDLEENLPLIAEEVNFEPSRHEQEDLAAGLDSVLAGAQMTPDQSLARRDDVSANDSASETNDRFLEYQAAVRLRIMEIFNLSSNSTIPEGCVLRLELLSDGAVSQANASACGTKIESQLAAAALMAQPLPYQGYEEVFKTAMDLPMSNRD